MEQSTGRSNGQTAISKRSTPQEHALNIRKLLMVLAEARQAAISQQAFEVYSTQLQKYELEDIKAAITKLSLTRRREGETAFPDLGTVDEAVMDERRIRWDEEAEAKNVIREAEGSRHRVEHPEDYVNMTEIAAEYFATKSMEAVLYATENEVPKNPREAIMAALSDGLAAGKDYEPALVAEIMAWRQKNG